MSKAESRSQSRSRVRSSTRSRVKDQGARQGDVDEALVGRRVSIAVVVGNRVARIVGTITVMGRFWVVVNVEESEIESLGGVVFLNKGSIVAYVPLPDNNTKA